MKHLRIELMLMLVVLFWGGNYAFSKWGLTVLSPQMFTLMRFTIVFLCLIAGTYLFEKSVSIHKEDWPRLIFVGFFGIALYQTLFMSSIKYTTTVNASLLNALSPIFTGILAILAKQERFSWRVQVGTCVAFAGAATMILFGVSGETAKVYPHHLYGDLIGLIAAIVFGAYPILTTPLLTKYSSMRVTAWSAGIAVPFLAMFSFHTAFSGVYFHLSERVWIGVLYAAIPVTVYGLVAWYYGIGRIGPTSVMVYMYAVPFVSTILAFFLLHEGVNWMQLTGGAIILCGIWIVKRKKVETVIVNGAPDVTISK